MRPFTKSALLYSAIVLLCASVALAQAPANWKSDLEQYRAKRAANLAAPEGWLSLVALEWVKPGSNTVGAAADNSIHLKTAPHIAVLRLDQGTITLQAPAAGFPAGMQVNGKPAAAGVLDTGEEHPSKLTVGTLSMIVIHRGDRYYLRVKDANAPTRVNFTGLHWYAPDEHYFVQARWIPYNPPKALMVPNILGMKTREVGPGVAEFTLDGKTLRLEPVLEEPTDTQLFFILRDTTSKTTTYGAGRFLYSAFPDHGLTQPGTITLDFNRLYNPPCAFTPYATCPLPPAQNRLPLAIPAGEKRYRDE